jgi:apolipoprotein N-acyltransferase
MLRGYPAAAYLEDDAPRTEFMVNLTNDNCLGRPRTNAAPVLAAFRSVEHRRWLVRSTNTGISAFVDATGRIRQKTPVMESSQIISDVPMLKGHTFIQDLGMGSAAWPYYPLLEYD